MIKNKSRIIFFIALLIGISSYAQDTLPNFTLRDLGSGKAQVSWQNKFDNIVQLTVQRSFDSTGFFKTIFSSESPWLPQNGFVDNKVPIGYRVFYRIQYVFTGGSYFFTKSKSPTAYTRIRTDYNSSNEPPPEGKEVEGKRYIKIYRKSKEYLINLIEYKDYRRFKDSIYRYTKDTLLYIDNDEAIIKPYIVKGVWKASGYVYTNDKGFIRITIPSAKQRKYKIIFFQEGGEEVLFIKQVKDVDLILDKSNFRHTGWYFFDLYEDEKLKEKNKFYLSKDR